MRCCNSYQDIKTPEEMYEDDYWDNELEAMLDDFDPEEAEANGCSYSTYKSNCIRSINKRRYENRENMPDNFI